MKRLVFVLALVAAVWSGRVERALAQCATGFCSGANVATANALAAPALGNPFLAQAFQPLPFAQATAGATPGAQLFFQAPQAAVVQPQAQAVPQILAIPVPAVSANADATSIARTRTGLFGRRSVAISRVRRAGW